MVILLVGTIAKIAICQFDNLERYKKFKFVKFPTTDIPIRGVVWEHIFLFNFQRDKSGWSNDYAPSPPTHTRFPNYMYLVTNYLSLPILSKIIIDSRKDYVWWLQLFNLMATITWQFSVKVFYNHRSIEFITWLKIKPWHLRRKLIVLTIAINSNKHSHKKTLEQSLRKFYTWIVVPA